MISHIVTLRSRSPLTQPDKAAEMALEQRLESALVRYCAGDAAAEDACRKWLAFERGILADSAIAPESLLALADAMAETKPEGGFLSSKAAAFLTFRLLGLSSLPPVRAAVPREGLPALIEQPAEVRWSCGLLPFRPTIRFDVRPDAPWLRGLLERLDRTAGAPPGTGWEIEFAESDWPEDRPAMPHGGTLAEDAAAAPDLFRRAVKLADAYVAAHGPEDLNGRMMFYEVGAARLLRDLPGLPLREAMAMAEKGRAWTRADKGVWDLRAKWQRYRGAAIDGPDDMAAFLNWANALRQPMLHAWALWFWAQEAQKPCSG